MNTKIKLISTLLGASTCISSAATLAMSDFDANDATTDNTKATGLTWTTDANSSMGDSGNLTAVGDTFSVFGGFSTVNNITSSTNLNSSRPTARGYSFQIITTADYNLTSLQILAGHVNSAGGDQSYTSNLDWSIGSLSGSVDNISYATGAVALTQNIALTGNTLSAGTHTVTVTINDMVGGGAFALYDGVTLSGDVVVPEPSSTLLFGLGGLSLLARRRR